MDAHLFRRFSDAIQPILLKARLDKIQSLSEDVYTFVFYTYQGKRQLCLRFGRQHSFLFLTEKALSAGVAPNAYVMRLRKYLQGKRVVAILPLAFHRKIWFLFESHTDKTSKNTIPSLCLDLREGATLAFLDFENLPEENDIVWPKGDDIFDACHNWQNWPVVTPDLRKTIAHLAPLDAEALLSDLESGGGDVFCYKKDANAPIDAIYAWPLPKELRKNKIEECGSHVIELIERAGQHFVFEALVSLQEKESQQAQAKALKKLQRLEKKLQEEETRLQRMCQAQESAIILQQNLWQLDKTQKVSTVSIPNTRGEDTTLPLDIRLTIQENMEHMFHTAQRGKRGLVYLKQRKQDLEQQKQNLQQYVHPHNTNGTATRNFSEISTLPNNVQGFCSSDGFFLLRGKDTNGNLACRKLAKGHDIWLHATDGPGAHVVIRVAYPGQTVPDRTLDEAGSLAACKSWQQKNTSARIQYAEIRHIKPMRGAAKGTVSIDKVLFTRNVAVDHSLEEKLAFVKNAQKKEEKQE